MSATSPNRAPSGGAYGFRIIGVPGAQSLLVNAPAHWPSLELRVKVNDEPGPCRERFDQRTAVLRLRSGGWVEIDRRAGCATFSMQHRPPDAALVHPHLAGVAAVAANWLGRESFHAGAFVVGGGAWGLLGDKGAGKSSLLAVLARSGVAVLADDVLVLDERTALAGPRSLDLRSDAARRLGMGEPLGVLGDRERWRVRLPPIAAELPLCGWVLLQWGTDAAVVRPRGSDRLRALLPHRGARLEPRDAGELIALSALPFLEFRRPPAWESASDGLGLLLDAVSEVGR